MMEEHDEMKNQLYFHFIENPGSIRDNVNDTDDYSYFMCRYICCYNVICFFIILSIIVIIVSLIVLMKIIY